MRSAATFYGGLRKLLRQRTGNQRGKMKQHSLGTYIRQLRKDQSLTQTELGGDRYSKSYVSALERGSLPPSHQALQYFAEQLHQPSDVFEQLWQFAQGENLLLPTAQEAGNGLQEQEQHQEVTMLLDLLIAETPLHTTPLEYDFLALPDETLKRLPLWKQAHYSFLKAVQAQ